MYKNNLLNSIQISNFAYLRSISDKVLYHIGAYFYRSHIHMSFFQHHAHIKIIINMRTARLMVTEFRSL